MKVGHGLTRRFLAVYNDPVAILDSQLLSQGYGHQMHVTQERFVFLLQVGVGRYHFLGNDKDVSWGFGVDIPKSQALIVLVNNRCRDLPVDNLEKEVVLKHG